MSFSKGYSPPSGYNTTQTPKMSPDAIKLYEQITKALGGSNLSGGIDYLGKVAAGDEATFKKIEAPAYQALQKGLAQTANRYSGVGAQDSSAFANAQAGQVGEMATNLAAQRHDMMQGAIDKLLNYSNQALGKEPYEYQLQESGLDIQKLIETFGPAIIDLILASQGAPPVATPIANSAKNMQVVPPKQASFQ